MPRASRHYIPGYVWHITHRCHKKEFLLKFARDRRRYLQWLFEARKRYGLSILNYAVTSNHVHLLVRDNGDRDVIPKSIQLIAGRTGQEFNQRKSRKGAYWEDRYHATAVETDDHLVQCLVYVDMNMVRVGVVEHPSQWTFGGYNEIQTPRERYALIDYDGLRDLLNFRSLDDLAAAYRGWIEDSLKEGNDFRDKKWTESIAVGSEAFVTTTKEKLGVNAKGREVIRKKIFPTLTKQQGFRIIVLFLILVWSVAIVGIGAWVWIESKPPNEAEHLDPLAIDWSPTAGSSTCRAYIHSSTGARNSDAVGFPSRFECRRPVARSVQPQTDLTQGFPLAILWISTGGNAMVTKIQKWGNSQGLRLARQVLEDAQISVGEEVDVTVRDGMIVIAPARRIRGKQNLKELVSRIPKNYKPGEVDWGEPVGREVW